MLGMLIENNERQKTMSNQNASQTNAAGGTAPATPKTPRESRNNHKAAEAHPITDAASAQRYADAVLADTKNDNSSTMLNGSGFVFPAVLSRQEVANLVRLGASINNALASKVADDGDEGDAARKGLTILADHASNAGTLQEEAKMARMKAQLDAYNAKQRAGKTAAR